MFSGATLHLPCFHPHTRPDSWTKNWQKNSRPDAASIKSRVLWKGSNFVRNSLTRKKQTRRRRTAIGFFYSRKSRPVCANQRLSGSSGRRPMGSEAEAVCGQLVAAVEAMLNPGSSAQVSLACRPFASELLITFLYGSSSSFGGNFTANCRILVKRKDLSSTNEPSIFGHVSMMKNVESLF